VGGGVSWAGQGGETPPGVYFGRGPALGVPGAGGPWLKGFAFGV